MAVGGGRQFGYAALGAPPVPASWARRWMMARMDWLLRQPARERETLGAYPHHGPWLESVERLKNTGDQGHERFEAVAVGDQNDDGDGKRLEVLLEFDVLVGGEDRVEFGGGLS